MFKADSSRRFLLTPFILQSGSSCGTRFIDELVKADSAYVVRIEENKPPVCVPASCEPMGPCLNACAPDSKSKQLSTSPCPLTFAYSPVDFLVTLP